MDFRCGIEKQLKKVICDFGKTIIIHYTSSAQPYGSVTFDPVNKEPVVSKFQQTVTASTLSVKAVVNTFVNSMGFNDYLLHKQGYVPDSDVRITCWLEDVLVLESSATGATYFDKSTKVKINGRFYTKKKIFRTGFDNPKLCIVNLDEVKNYA